MVEVKSWLLDGRRKITDEHARGSQRETEGSCRTQWSVGTRLNKRWHSDSGTSTAPRRFHYPPCKESLLFNTADSWEYLRRATVWNSSSQNEFLKNESCVSIKILLFIYFEWIDDFTLTRIAKCVEIWATGLVYASDETRQRLWGAGFFCFVTILCMCNVCACKSVPNQIYLMKYLNCRGECHMWGCIFFFSDK